MGRWPRWRPHPDPSRLKKASAAGHPLRAGGCTRPEKSQHECANSRAGASLGPIPQRRTLPKTRQVCRIMPQKILFIAGGSMAVRMILYCPLICLVAFANA